MKWLETVGRTSKFPGKFPARGFGRDSKFPEEFPESLTKGNQRGARSSVTGSAPIDGLDGGMVDSHAPGVGSIGSAHTCARAHSTAGSTASGKRRTPRAAKGTNIHAWRACQLTWRCAQDAYRPQTSVGCSATHHHHLVHRVGLISPFAPSARSRHLHRPRGREPPIV